MIQCVASLAVRCASPTCPNYCRRLEVRIKEASDRALHGVFQFVASHLHLVLAAP